MPHRLLVLISAVLAALVMPLAAYAAPARPAVGEFTASIDPVTLGLTPQGSTCLITVEGQLVFSGTLEGTATGTTAARTLAPCEDVAATDPGTFQDVFRADLHFHGMLGDEPVDSAMTYQGVTTAPDGAITGQFVLSDGMNGALRVDAVILEGGTYRGVIARR